MNADELQNALDKLHLELSQTAAVDDATRKRLQDVIAEIQRLVGPSEPSKTAPEPTEQPLTHSLQGMVADFEARHPQLTTTVQQLVDRLAEIGI